MIHVPQESNVTFVGGELVDGLDEEERAVLEWTADDVLVRLQNATPARVARSMPWRIRLRRAYMALKGRCV